MKYRVSIVSYSNTIPFVYGIMKSTYLQNNILLAHDIPAECARKLLFQEVDLGLVPVAILPKLSNYTIVSDFCIGADGAVESVVLCSNVPLTEIDTVISDSESRTSNLLTKVLAKEFWNIKPNWIDSQIPNYVLDGNDGIVLIGDKAILYQAKYKYDLALEWKKFTDLPFVFACWVTTHPVSSEFASEFNAALQFGVSHIDDAITSVNRPVEFNLQKYLSLNINYNFDDKKREALTRFLTLSQNIE